MCSKGWRGRGWKIAFADKPRRHKQQCNTGALFSESPQLVLGRSCNNSMDKVALRYCRSTTIHCLLPLMWHTCFWRLQLFSYTIQCPPSLLLPHKQQMQRISKAFMRGRRRWISVERVHRSRLFLVMFRSFYGVLVPLSLTSIGVLQKAFVLLKKKVDGVAVVEFWYSFRFKSIEEVISTPAIWSLTTHHLLHPLSFPLATSLVSSLSTIIHRSGSLITPYLLKLWH